MKSGKVIKPQAGVSLDLDNLWSYMKTHGDSGWESYPSYLNMFIPRVCDILDSLDMHITFFIVGKDASLAKNRDALREITRRGHEVGNHSFHHEQLLFRYTREQVDEEILRAEEAIVKGTEQRPFGFRGPGFCWSHTILEVLAAKGYRYDASSLPSYLGPLGRLYYFSKSPLSAKDKEEHRILFGGFREGRRPVKPYIWEWASGKRILEIPVTTMPLFKIPIHFSYLLYLSRFTERLMTAYIHTAAQLCKLTGSGMSFLLHPLDFMDRSQFPGLSFFPAMDVDREAKIDLFRKVTAILSRSFQLMSLNEYAEEILGKKEKLRICRLSPSGGLGH